MRTAITTLLATAFLAAPAMAQQSPTDAADEKYSSEEFIDNRPAGSENDAVVDAPPVSDGDSTAEMMDEEYSGENTEEVITEAPAGKIDGVPGGDAPDGPITADGDTNEVMDEKIGG